MKRVTLSVRGGNKLVARRWQRYRRDGLYKWRIDKSLKAGDYSLSMSGDERASYYLLSINLPQKAKLNSVTMPVFRHTPPSLAMLSNLTS